MPTPISALEHRPFDFVREVSRDAIDFYVDDLSGLYLPDEFKEKYADVGDVKRWEPERRLSGKFGRLAVSRTQEDDQNEILDGILVMGTTIGLSGLDRDGYMESLRHYSFSDKFRRILRERELIDDSITVNEVDYGDTRIKLNEDGRPEAISVSGNSFDFGRAAAEGRQETCDMFAKLLGDEIHVINSDPEPRDFDDILR